jgi:hypothetical protein
MYIDGKAELLEGWFDKKTKEKKSVRTEITADDRKMITSVFKTNHNADMKHGDETYVLPDSVYANYKNARVTFFKHGDQLLASVAWYRDEDGPGNPRKSPLFHEKEDRKINNAADLKKIKGIADGEKMSVKQLLARSRHSERVRSLP